MERGEILDQMSELYDTHCKSCEKWKAVAEKRVSTKVDEFCHTQCNIGKKLLRLGDYITYGRPAKVARKLTKDVYIKEKEKGLTDEQICKKYGITVKPLVFRKNHWKVGYGIKRATLTKKEYLEMKAQGLPDAYIAKKVDLHFSTMTKLRADWDLKADIQTMNYLEKGINQEDITFENYFRYRTSGLKDIAIREIWGIGRTTLQRRKREWRECGYDVDKFNNNIPHKYRKMDEKKSSQNDFHLPGNIPPGIL